MCIRDSLNTFTITTDPPDCISFATSPKLYRLHNERTFSTSKPLVKPNTVCKVKATLVNFIGNTATDEIEIVTSPESGHAIHVEGVAVNLKRHVDNIVKVRLIKKICEHGYEEEGCPGFAFELEQLNTLSEQIPSSKIVWKNCWTFVILANALDWKKDYWVLVKGISTTDPSYVIMKKVLIRAELEKPIALIKGSSKTLSYIRELSLEGVCADERDPSEALTFEWECYYDLGTQEVCRDSQGANITLPSNTSFKFKTDVIIKGKFSICLKIRSTWKSLEVIGDRVCQEVTLSLQETLLHPQILTSSPYFNTNADYYLACYASLNYGEVEYTWSSASSTPFHSLDSAQPKEKSQYVVVKAGAATSSADQELTCEVKLKGASNALAESTTLKLPVNEPPYYSPSDNKFLKISPSQGQELSDIFTIEAMNWEDGNNEDYPLRYSFYYKIGNEERQAIKENTLNTYVVTHLPAGNSLNHEVTIQVVVSDSKGAASNPKQITLKVYKENDPEKKLEAIRDILSKASMDYWNNFVHDISTVRNYINSVTNTSLKAELYQELLNKFKGFNLDKEDGRLSLIHICRCRRRG
eukprot:TRINITY_DN7332_c0_g1_i1.p1 TRINITY_DN7332_c0_g1~~TRINITY_DN7332_c0_g1_i1.p1  ORF type:complete len:591 (+),score=112.67 TRINITY_DN7332_c0_g1_i1:26-1774(+)